MAKWAQHTVAFKRCSVPPAALRNTHQQDERYKYASRRPRGRGSCVMIRGSGGGEGEKWCAGRQVGTAPSETQATMALQNAWVLSPKSYDPDLLGRFHVVIKYSTYM